jgi:hypothetical protein
LRLPAFAINSRKSVTKNFTRYVIENMGQGSRLGEGCAAKKARITLSSLHLMGAYVFASCVVSASYGA